MPLPLNDKNNPLYGLGKEKQCEVVLQWQCKGITPNRLFSLPVHYNQNQITKAYRQLATLFHPDSRKDKAQSNEASVESFKLIGAAREYLEYGLKRGMERYNAGPMIKNNVFYKVYGEPEQGRVGFNASRPVQTTRASASTDRTAKKAKSYEEMSYFELLYLICVRPKDMVALPDSMVRALKKHIITDPTLINKYQPKIEGRSSTIGQIIASFGDFKFLRWLIDREADPYLMTMVHYNESSKDIIALIIEKGNVPLLRHLLEQRGQQVFYPGGESDDKNHQWWWFRLALAKDQFYVALFLLEEAGFSQYVHQQFEGSFYDCTHRIRGFLRDGHYNRPSTQEKKMVLQIAGLLLDQEQIAPEFLYCGIEDLLIALDDLSERSRAYKSDNYLIKKEIFKLLNQLVKRLDIQAEELGAIEIDVEKIIIKPRDRGNPRKACIARLYNYALRYAGYEILQQLRGIASLPQLDRPNREHLLWRSISNCHSWQPTDNPDAKTRREVETTYQRILTLLLDSGCFGQPDDKYALDVYTGVWAKEYQNYTLLHLACEVGWGGWALQLINRTPNGIKSLNTRFIRNDHDVNDSESSPPRKVYQYCSLHLAIQRNLPRVAVRLIEAGADINIKGIVDKPSSSCCFSLFGRMKHIEQTPLEMAIEKQQPQVIRTIQRVMLENYIKQREREDEYLSQLTVFGYVLFVLGSFNFFGHIFGFGYSKTEKLDKARAFRDLLNSDRFDEDSFNQFNDGAAEDGRLGEIVQLSQYYLTEESLAADNHLAI